MTDKEYNLHILRLLLRISTIYICVRLLINQIKQKIGLDINCFGVNYRSRFLDLCDISQISDNYSIYLRRTSIAFLLVTTLLIVVAWILNSNQKKIGNIIEIATCVSQIIVITAANIITMRGMRADKSFDEEVFWLLVRIIVIGLFFVTSLKMYLLRNGDKSEEDNKEKCDDKPGDDNGGKIWIYSLFSIIVIILIYYITGAVSVNSKFSHLVGVYENESHSLDENRTKDILNYPNVVSDGKCLYINEQSSITKFDENGNSTSIKVKNAVDSSEEYLLMTIDYYDGYIYSAAYVYPDSSMDTENTAIIIIGQDGVIVEELKRSEDSDRKIIAVGVRDGYVYYETYANYREYFESDEKMTCDIYRINIKTHEEELYLGKFIYDCNASAYEYENGFFARIICDDIDYWNASYGYEVEDKRVKYSNYNYSMEKVSDSEGFDLIKSSSEESNVIAENVLCYTLDDEYIYYVTGDKVFGEDVKLTLYKLSKTEKEKEILSSYDNIYVKHPTKYEDLYNFNLYEYGDKLVFSFHDSNRAIKERYYKDTRYVINK